MGATGAQNYARPRPPVLPAFTGSAGPRRNGLVGLGYQVGQSVTSALDLAGNTTLTPVSGLSGVMVFDYVGSGLQAMFDTTLGGPGGIFIMVNASAKIEVDKRGAINYLVSTGTVRTGTNVVAWSLNTAAPRLVISLNGAAVDVGTPNLTNVFYTRWAFGTTYNPGVPAHQTHAQYLSAVTREVVLTDAAVRSLSADPWQMFVRPSRRPRFGASGAFQAAWARNANTVLGAGAPR